MNSSVFRWLVASAVVTLAALLGGCGFHLPSQAPVPLALQSVYIDVASRYHVEVPPLERALAKRLRRRGSRVVSSPEQARSILRISNLRKSRETAAIGANGRAVEFRLVTSVTFELESGGKVVLPPQTQSASSEYSFNATQILAAEQEEVRLEKYLQDELAEMILLRLDAQLSDAGQRIAPTIAGGHD